MSELKLDPLKRNCNLCGKGQDDVKLVIAGLYGNVCNTCISECVQVLAENISLEKPDE